MQVTASNKPLPYITTLVCEWLSQTWCHGYRVPMLTMDFCLCLTSDIFLFGVAWLRAPVEQRVVIVAD